MRHFDQSQKRAVDGWPAQCGTVCTAKRWLSIKRAAGKEVHARAGKRATTLAYDRQPRLLLAAGDRASSPLFHVGAAVFTGPHIGTLCLGRRDAAAISRRISVGCGAHAVWCPADAAWPAHRTVCTVAQRAIAVAGSVMRSLSPVGAARRSCNGASSRDGRGREACAKRAKNDKCGPCHFHGESPEGRVALAGVPKPDSAAPHISDGGRGNPLRVV